MRYWIYWNDLVQGPFELEELTSLHAFSEELLVCMEGREDWLPAARVADLAPAIELWRGRRTPPPPPPPPPSRPPAVDPVQGDLFGEPFGQQHFFEGPDDVKGTLSYAPPVEAPPTAQSGLFTMPIRFGGRIPQPHSTVTTVEAPSAARPIFEVLEAPSVRFDAPAPVKESPIRKEEPFPQAPIIEAPAPDVPEIAAEAPAPVVEPEAPAIPPAPVIPKGPVLPEIDRYAVAASRRVPGHDLRLLPWILGFIVILGLLGTASYWLIDHFTSKAAIAEVARLSGHRSSVRPAAAPAPVPVAAPPLPVVAPPVPVKPVVQVPKAAKAKKAAKAAKKPVHVVALPKAARAAAPVFVAPTSAPAPAPAPKAASAPPARTAAPDPWINRQNEAIQIAMNSKIFGGKRTVGAHAKAMLQSMHGKELMHAAETGERLYLPDKSNWTALREDGSVYRVYLNFSALQANGERVQTRSYQFRVDLKSKQIASDDNATHQDFLDATTMPVFEHQQMADDIDSILGGVDSLNKQRMTEMIVKRNKPSKRALKQIETALAAAEARLQRATVYFRTRYQEKALQNVAHAYAFTDLLKSNG